MTQQEKDLTATTPEAAVTEVEKKEKVVEPEIDHKAEINAFLVKHGITAENQLGLRAVDTSERIGRQVGIQLRIDGSTETLDAPRQDFIQVLFENDWHRSQIMKVFEGPVVYQIIFAATKGMENKHHKEGTNAGVGNFGRAGKTYTFDIGNGEEAVTRKQLFAYLVTEKQLTRGDIVKFMKEQFGEDIAYPTVFQATKDLDVPKPLKKEKTEKPAKAEKVAAVNTDDKAAKKAKAAKEKAAKAAAAPAVEAPSDNRDNELTL